MKFTIFLAILLAFSCRKPPQYATADLSQTSILNTRLAYLDERYSSKELCDDYRLMRNLRYYLHNDDKQTVPSDECPKDFRDFVLKIKSALAGLNDLHTHVLFGNGLDVISFPIVTACEGDAEACAEMLGSPVYPIRANLESNFYAGIFNRKSKLVPFEVKTINARTVLDFRKAMDAEFLYSHTKANWSQNLMEYILRRSILSEQDRSPLTLEARSLINQKSLRITASFDSLQRVFPAAEAVGVLQSISLGREYGCTEPLPGSTFDIGACRRSDGKAIVWLANWPQAEAFEQFQVALADWLAAQKAKQVYLDLRSNGGGNPLSVVSFLCRFGDEKTSSALAKTNLSVRLWPKSFANEGAVVESEKLEVLDNLELRRIDASFLVSGFAREMPKSFSMGYLERSSLDAKGCDGKRAGNLKDTTWKVLTDGGEFSAAEDFLFLAKQSPGKFKIYGRPSVGGAGNPSWISLPNTKAGVRLSPARPLFDNQMVIEKSGVMPDIFVQIEETAPEMEARILRFAENGIFLKDDHIATPLWEAFFKD